MRHTIVFLLLLPFSAIANDAQPCHDHLKFGLKDKQEQIDQELCRDGYAVGYSYYYKTPLWVAYEITKASVSPNHGRTTTFPEDTDIPEEYRSTNWDYKYSGYDRGHMASRATMDFTRESRNQSFLLSNMTPQHARFNQDGWADLEAEIRDLTESFEPIYVVTGALFDGDNETIGKGVGVPSHLYKVLYIPSDEKMIGWIIPNASFNIDDLKQYQKTIKKIENRVGLDFFNKITNDKEKQLERVLVNDLL